MEGQWKAKVVYNKSNFQLEIVGPFTVIAFALSYNYKPIGEELEKLVKDKTENPTMQAILKRGCKKIIF